MKKVYLDHAATTTIAPEVIDAMLTSMKEDFGNPSSTHSFGRQAKSSIELARKSIAKNINATASEIVFTSCGTESNNWVFRNAMDNLQVKRIISSPTEHHAVLHTLEEMTQNSDVDLVLLKILPDGQPDLVQLAELLAEDIKTLVSLMHVNNETGVVTDIQKVGELCRQHQAYFHSDTVQSMGKTAIDVQQLPVDFLVASAHKFNGPKGIGFLYIRKGLSMQSMLLGGEQEKGLRAGTESVHNIIGMAKALEISLEQLAPHRAHILSLRAYLISALQEHFPGFKINGSIDGFYNIINVMLPFAADKTAMILFHLDMKGIAVSRGSACQSGSISPSHVLAQMLSEDDLQKPSLRISLSHLNTQDDLDYLIEALKTV